MQVLLRKSDVAEDIRCEICGQGFRLYWERASDADQVSSQAEIRAAIHRHHVDSTEPGAHPVIPFNVPSWPGLPQFSAAALLGGLSGIRRVPPTPLAAARNS